MWTPQRKVTREDNCALVHPFTLVEVTNNLNYMRVNTALGPDGFPVIFYKRFCEMVGPQFLNLVQEFTLGRIEVKIMGCWRYSLKSKGRITFDNNAQ